MTMFLILIVTCLATINAQTPSPEGTATSSAGTSTILTIPEVSASISGAKITVSGKATLSDNNLIGGDDNAIEIPIKIEPEGVEGLSLTLTTKFGLQVKECSFTKKISVTVSVQLAVPDAFGSAMDVLNTAISKAPSKADLTKKYSFTFEVDPSAAIPDGVTVTAGFYLKIALDVKAFSKKIKPELYQILLMTGSNIVISTSIEANLAGLEFPLEIDATLLDPAKMEIPSDDACGKGSKICDESDYGEIGLAYTVSAKACQAMCSVANTATSNKAALKEKIDVVKAIKVPLEAAAITGISVVSYTNAPSAIVLGKIETCGAGFGQDDGASLTLSFAVLFILAVTSALSY